MSSHRLAFPLPPTQPLFNSRTVPRHQLGLASSNEAPFLPSTSSTLRSPTMTHESPFESDDQAWTESLSAFQEAAASHRRGSASSTTSASSSNGSESEPSTAATSRSGSGGEDLLDCLGRGAVDLLEQFEQDCSRQSPPRRPTRRVPQFEDLVASSSDPTWSPPAGSPVAGPSTYQRTRRPKEFAGARTLNASTSVATLRSTPTRKAPSFTSTDVSELDIEAILNAYGDWHDDLMAITAATERTPRQPTSTSGPTRAKSFSGSSSRVVNRELVFPSPTSTSAAKVDRSIPALPRHPAEVSSPPYSDFFPRHRVSPFPTKKKSTASLRSQAQTSTLPSSPPPMPDITLAFPAAPRHLASPISPTSPERRQSSVYSSDSSSSPRSSGRASYQSSSASGSATGSFRWSTASGSTAPTIAEESDWDASKRDSVAGSSCRSFGSSSASRRPSLAGSIRSTKSTKALRSMNELMDWTSFAEEILDEQEAEADAEETSEGDRRRRATSLRSNKSARPSAKSLRRAQSIKGSLHSNNSTSSVDTEVAPPLPTLAKKHSLLSLRHIRSTASLAAKQAPPPIPARSPSRFHASMSRQ